MVTRTLNQTEEEVWQEFYTKLGYLYYGVASAAYNGNVDGETFALLKRSINRIWMNNDGDLPGFQGYTQNRVEAILDWLNLNETSWEDCVQEFSYFIKNHTEQMSTYLMEFVRNSADEVARFMGASRNPALTKLQELLQSLA